MSTNEPCDARAAIRDFINESVKIDGIRDDDNLFESGLVNSLFAVQLMTFIERRFGFEVEADDLDIKNFQSINSTAEFVARKTSNQKT